MNVILSQHFFSDNSKYLALYMKVLELVVELTKTLDIKNCEGSKPYIKAVKDQVKFETTEFKENVEDFLKSLNGGELDWKSIKNSKEQRKEFFGRLNDGRMETLLGIALLIRAHQGVLNFYKIIKFDGRTFICSCTPWRQIAISKSQVNKTFVNNVKMEEPLSPNKSQNVILNDALSQWNSYAQS